MFRDNQSIKKCLICLNFKKLRIYTIIIHFNYKLFENYHRMNIFVL